MTKTPSPFLRGALLMLCAVLLSALVGGCSEARENTEKVTEEVTGYHAIKKGQELEKQLREVGAAQKRDLEEVTGK